MSTVAPSDQLAAATTPELLAHLLGATAAEQLLRAFCSLSEVARHPEQELIQLAGLTPARSRRLRAALLLAQRLLADAPEPRPLLDTPERVADALREGCRGYQVETFQLALLNTRRRLIRWERVSQGTLDTLLIHAREVFRPAILWGASAVVIAHNHPSGDPTPSEADIKVTRDLIRAGQLLKIEVLDHIILGQRTSDRPKDYTSLRELGYFAC